MAWMDLASAASPEAERKRRNMNEEKLAAISKESEEKMQRLKNAKAEELLEAAILHYSSQEHFDRTLFHTVQSYPNCEKWLRFGFALAQPGGWEKLASEWLEVYRSRVAFETRDYESLAEEHE